ncbi:MAG: glycosyltransferase family 4 protein [Coriobacteriia bacterium]|nr:glycosyltransferase family 4 protein [Coriobacteriia bacterium]
MTDVIYDYQAFSMQQTGGVSRYFAQLIKAFEQDPDLAVTPYLQLSYAANRYLKDDLDVKASPLFHRYQGRGRGKLQGIGNIANRNATFQLLLRHMDAIYHPTYFDPWFLHMREGQKNLSFANPMVVTVHDMIHELRSDQVADPQTVAKKRAMMHHADAIVAVSAATMDDIVALYPDYKSKITVIHHGNSLDDEVTVGNFPHDEPYLLFVGNRWGYKNFHAVAHACVQLFADYPDLQLVCAGGGTFTSAEMELLRSLGISSRVMQHNPSDEVLKAMYQGAAIFVFPSQYEGFGLPVLEAMGNGASCVLSDSSSLPEVGADAALYFDAGTADGGADELAQQCKCILDDSTVRKQLIAAGYSRATQFSWQKCAQQHADLYTSLHAKVKATS